MIQTWAIFKDAYRELNAKKLFWIVMAVSVAVVTSFALLGNNERGMTVLGYTLEVPIFSTRAVSPAGFYKFVFSNVGVNLWLTWGAAILALISTAGMIPEFVSSGSIDMSLCKPIGRLRLFLTKYAAGLLFVALQVIIFSIGAFLVIGIRGKSWEPSVFLAVPLVVIFYSYLFCVCALVGLVTRSGITALLLTLLFWFVIWGFGTAEVTLLRFSLDAKRDMEREQSKVRLVEQGIASLKERAETLKKEQGSKPSADVPAAGSAPASDATAKPADAAAAASNGDANPNGNGSAPPRGRARRDWEKLTDLTNRIQKMAAPTNDVAELERRIAEQETQLETFRASAAESAASHKSLSRWQKGLFIGKTVLPKTTETADLLKRYVIDKKDRDGLLQMIEEQSGDPAPKDVQAVLDGRSIGWVAGTSAAFEAIVLIIACWYFCRKDF